MSIDHDSIISSFYIWYFRKYDYFLEVLPVHLESENDVAKLVLRIAKNVLK